MNNYPCTIRSTLIDQNPDEVYHTLFMVSLDRCNVSCNAVENSFCKICVLNNIEDVDLKVLNMIIGINESKNQQNIFHVHIIVELKFLIVLVLIKQVHLKSVLFGTFFQMMCIAINSTDILNTYSVDHRCIIDGISKNEPINFP